MPMTKDCLRFHESANLVVFGKLFIVSETYVLLLDQSIRGKRLSLCLGFVRVCPISFGQQVSRLRSQSRVASVYCTLVGRSTPLKCTQGHLNEQAVGWL